MLLIEADGKALLRDAGIAVPDSVLLETPAPWAGAVPVMLKAQVPAGGRGKAGGVLRCATAAEVEPALHRLLGARISGHVVRACLLEAPASGRECYLSIMLDAAAGAARLTFIAEGGVEVESQAASLGDHASRLADLDTASMNAALHAITAALPADEAAAVRDLGARLISLFLAKELMLAEINPLFVDGGNAVAGDAKIVLDMNAIHRQPVLEAILRARPAIYADACRKLIEGFDYVEMDAEGRIGLITTGAGLSMALVDEMTARGARPLNFLDIRTSQLRGSPARLIRVMQWMAERPSLRVIFVNIFAGITDQREFAGLLADALDQAPVAGLPVVARLVGNGAAEASAALAARRPDIAIFADLEPALARVTALAA